MASVDVKYNCSRHGRVVTGYECALCYAKMGQVFKGLNKVPATRAACVAVYAKRIRHAD